MNIALITGASKGIGLATAKQLIQEGWQVVGLARKNSLSKSDSFTPYDLDLADLSTLPTHLQKIQKAHPSISALICNAGRGLFGSLEEYSYQQMHSLIEMNFLSQAYLVKAFLPELKRQKKGHIIFMGSEAALQGKRMGSIYCASKFALRGFAQALREECATSQVRVTLINPGMVQTDFFSQLSFRPGEDPLEHLVPEDIAAAISWALHAREGTVLEELSLSST